MNSKRSAIPTLSALFLVLGSTSWAWGPVGHKAIGMIAQSRLSPQALQAVQTILGSGVDLQKIANCPDQFVFTPDTNCAGVFTMTGDPHATKHWHYVDTPITANVDAASLMSFCPQDDCSVAQIRKDIAVLQDPAAALQDKRMALMFLVHFVGDEHQPLHNETGVPDDFGGNLKIMNKMIYLGKPQNLHTVWDEAIEDPAKVDYRLPDGDLTAQAETLARSLGSGIQDAASWLTGDFISGASVEGHDIAQTVIYPAYAASNGNDLLADYQAKMQPIAFKRIQMAGVRLASLLEQALVPSASSNASTAHGAAVAKSLAMLTTTKAALAAQ